MWRGSRVLVTGGASFIGSHLVDKLVELGAEVTVVDNFSSGRIENLQQSIDRINVVKLDLEYESFDEILKVFKGHEIVFHLAAVHGGRGYIHTHPADVSSIFAIDHRVFEASVRAGVDKVVYASSACVYPPRLQAKIGSDYLLREEDSDPFKLDEPMSADLEYGWAKLMGEVQLIAFIKQYGLKGVSLRFVTAYGPRENETHAIIALIYKAFERGRLSPHDLFIVAELKLVNGIPVRYEVTKKGGEVEIKECYCKLKADQVDETYYPIYLIAAWGDSAEEISQTSLYRCQFPPLST